MDYKDLVCLDFETYYANDYSLSLPKYNTSEYIRDPQFLIHGVGIQCHGHEPYWVGGHDEALQELQSLDLQDRPVVAHNMAFDGFILHHHADLTPAFYCDTLSMARAALGHHTRHNLNTVASLLGLGNKFDGLENTKGKRKLTPEEEERLARYCKRDTSLCSEIFWKLLSYVPHNEMRLIDLTLRMFCTPKLRVNTERVMAEYHREKEDTAERIERTAVGIETLRSNEKFAEALRIAGVNPPIKTSITTGEKTYAFAKTDKGFQRLLESEDEVIQLLAEARQSAMSNIGETRALRLYNAGLNGWPLPVLLNYAGAHTFRWSGGNKLNLQNLPRGSELRRSIIAPPGHQLLVYDQSQIEARGAAWFCNESELVRAFAEFDAGTGPDVYRAMASRIYGVPVDRVSKEQRFIGKVCVLGLGYGMGWKKLRATLAMGFMGPPVHISEDEARRITTIYRRANINICLMWDRLNVMLENMVNPNFHCKVGPVTFLHKMIELPSGLALKYPGLAFDGDSVSYLGRKKRIKIWGGMLLENIIQALARCVIAEQMLKISERYFIATMTHDEIVVVVPTSEIETAYEWVGQIMVTPPVWAPDLPLAVEGGWDTEYSK